MTTSEATFAVQPSARGSLRNPPRFTVWGAVILALLALASRLPYFAFSPFPLNDGGMFAQILDDLRANHWWLPRETTYNFQHIPLCYPPLGFYFGAAAASLFRQGSMQVLRWLPLLFNLASLPVVYLIGLEFFIAPVLAFSGTAVYAVTPRSSSWLVMGGGLTRAPGQLFALLAILFFLRARREPGIRNAVLAGVWTGAAVLTHFEAAAFAVASLVLLSVQTPRFLRTFRSLLTAGCVSAVVIAPWVLLCTVRFGAAPFAAAFLTRGSDGSASVGLKLFEVMPWLEFALALFLLRKPPFVLWILALMIFVPRSSDTHIVLPGSLLAAWFVSLAIERFASVGFSERAIGSAGAAICVLLGALWTVSYEHRHLLPGHRLDDLIQNERATLTPTETAAMRWVNEQTPPAARFLVYDQRTDVWATDFVAEWFPYLARHRSVMTAQGREWLPGRAFARTVDSVPKFNQVFSDEDVHRKLSVFEFDYIFLAGPFDRDHEHVRQALAQWPGFTRVVYHAPDIEILGRAER